MIVPSDTAYSVIRDNTFLEYGSLSQHVIPALIDYLLRCFNLQYIPDQFICYIAQENRVICIEV